MPLRFFNIDLHISVIEDVKTIWKSLFRNIEIVDWSISGHAHLFKHTITDSNPILNQRTWRQFDHILIKTFQQQYDHLLKDFDGFIVTHSPIFAMLFEKYEKPIIIVNSCRYHQPLCWSKNDMMLKSFHNTLHNLFEKGLLTIIHNNRGDAKFFNDSFHHPFSRQYYIPSLCQYINSFYNPIRKTILVDDPRHFLDSLKHPLLFRKKYPYEWKDLYEHQAVIVIPREISYMTFFEYLEACIPILIPTRRLLCEWIKEKGCFLGTLKSYNMNGNIEDWIEYADFYDNETYDGCIPFDSMDELHDILDDSQFSKKLERHHSKMKKLREHRTKMVENGWKEVFHFDIFRFVNYNFWSCLANYHLDFDYALMPLCQPFYKYNSIEDKINIEKMKPNDVIFVKTDYFQKFVMFIHNHIKVSYRLLLGVSDLSPSNHLLQHLVNDPLCQHIYATNTMFEHSKLTPIPIGFSEPMRENGNGSLLHYWEAKSRGSHKHKEIDLLVRYFSDTIACRRDVLEKITKFLMEDRRFLNTVRLTYNTKDANELHDYLHRSKYAIVLRGNGIDTHYFYECILNECVPIFVNEVEFPLYKRFGCCIQVRSMEFLEQKYSKVEMDKFYENIDWEKEKINLYRRSYRDLK